MFFIETYMKLEHMIFEKLYICVECREIFVDYRWRIDTSHYLILCSTGFGKQRLVLERRNLFWEANTGLRTHIHTTRVKIR